MPATEFLCPLWYVEGMKSKYLLIRKEEVYDRGRRGTSGFGAKCK